ncbi:ABC transporter substrate-binding protein [Fulvimarina sp. MAC8]|uniref:ABC transporter substrate-binding protein n=1 Tax=Fulvimarina sp. MAC8 TaxID=3162874 RepID=UPI0032EAD2AA
MTFTRRLVLAAIGASALTATSFAASAQELPGNVRLVIGSSSTGGDTYQSASLVADALSKELGINVKVDAVGATEAFKAVGRDPRGTTLMLHHDQSYLGELYGQKGYEDIFEAYKIGPTVAINPGNAYLAGKGSKYKSMEEIFAAAANGEQVRVAIQPGGVSEIGFSAMKNAARLNKEGSEENIVAVNTGDQASKNQALWDNLADVINGSIQANEQFTQLPEDDQKAMQFVWITATPDALEQAPEAGMGNLTRDDMLKFASPEVSVPLKEGEDFTFDKEFFFIYNKDMDDAIVKQIDDALTAVYDKGELQKEQAKAFFTPDFRPSAEAVEHLKEKNDTYAEVIGQISGEGAN